jgi:hypothetical protein
MLLNRQPNAHAQGMQRARHGGSARWPIGLGGWGAVAHTRKASQYDDTVRRARSCGSVEKLGSDRQQLTRLRQRADTTSALVALDNQLQLLDAARHARITPKLGDEQEAGRHPHCILAISELCVKRL